MTEDVSTIRERRSRPGPRTPSELGFAHRGDDAAIFDYRYSTIISPGDYTLAFTCQAGLDDPETDDDILFSAGVDATQ